MRVENPFKRGVIRLIRAVEITLVIFFLNDLIDQHYLISAAIFPDSLC